MNIQTLEVLLTDEDLAIDGCCFRNKGEITFPSHEKAKDFLIKFLVLETTAGVNYTDEEVLNAYKTILHLVNTEKEISSSILPYHQAKAKPDKEVLYILNGCHCFKR